MGKFTIIDDATVQEADLGVNFFLDDNSLGKSRAQACTELLLELNPEVQGDWYPKNQVNSRSRHCCCHPEWKTLSNVADHTMEQEPLDLDKVLAEAPTFTMIVYTYPIHPDHLKVLQDYGGKHLTPLVAVHSAGLYSYFRMSLPGTFPIVDTHPDESATTDLRLLSPWPELQTFASDLTKDIDALGNHEHGHIPYVVLLLHFLEKWKETHGDYPTKYADKTEFRKTVAAAARTDTPEGGEENFDEAAAAVVKTVVPPSVPSSLKEVFDYNHGEPVSVASLVDPRILNTDANVGLSRTSKSRASGLLPMLSRNFMRSTAPCHFQGMYLT